jgi:SAM-dependent methyltransferase
MVSQEHTPPRLDIAIANWWRGKCATGGTWKTAWLLLRELCSFLYDSIPSRRRQRYGDMDYDWDFRVDTTSGTVGWRDRLLGVFYSPYQPTEPALFHQMMSSLHIDFSAFTFIDLGSGKGRALLMASEYAFRRIVGVELLPTLHQAAVENLRRFHSPAQRCFAIESRCEDARCFQFPAEPLVLYLFNPLPENDLAEVMRKVEASLHEHRRPVRVLYHNPLLRHVLDACSCLQLKEGTVQYLVYAESADGMRPQEQRNWSRG